MADQQGSEVVIVGADGREHVFPAGFDPRRAAAIVRGAGQPEQPAVPEQPIQRPMGGTATSIRPARAEGIFSRLYGAVSEQPIVKLVSRVATKENLPIIGALAATPFTGGMGLLPAAGVTALGGATGSVIKNADDLSSGDQARAVRGLKSVATDAVTQGALEVGGGVVGKGLQLTGKGAYHAALRPAIALRRKYGDLVAKGLERAIPVSERAVEPTRAAMMASKDAARDAVRGVPVQTADVVRGLKPVGQEMGTQVRAGMPDARPQLVSQIRQFKAKNPAAIPGEQLAELKHARDMAADAAFRAEAKGAQPGTSGLIDEGFSTAMGDAMAAQVPGVKAINRNTMDLFGLSRSLEDAANRSHQLTNLFSTAAGVGAAAAMPGGATDRGGAGVGGAAAIRALGSPYLQSIAGIGLDRAGRAPLAQMIRMALIAGMTGSEQEQQ